MAQRAAGSCKLFLSLGTSSVVYPAGGLIDLALQNGARILEVNPEETAYSRKVHWSIRGKSGEVLPRLMQSLRWGFPMSSSNEQLRVDFEQAMGESFSECLAPPIPFEDASAHDCCEVIWAVLGYEVTPTRLAALTEAQVGDLARKFGDYFGSESPTVTVHQIREAVARTLARWPVGSLGE
jgi:hypothetical protein